MPLVNRTNKPERTNTTVEPVCKACGHRVSHHVDEGDRLRCHSLVEEGDDWIQCECRIPKSPFKRPPP